MIGFVSKIKNLTIQSLNIVISSFTLCSQPFGLIFQYTILESLNGVTYSSPPRLSCTRRKFKAATPNTHFGIVYVATPIKLIRNNYLAPPSISAGTDLWWSRLLLDRLWWISVQCPAKLKFVLDVISNEKGGVYFSDIFSTCSLLCVIL